MRHIQTDVLVIGGGATGTGVLRDLAMRGFKCVLVERRDLAYGTTGRYHGLLHSGCRYVVKDPEAARECYEENQILRRIMPQCIEDTGGYYVLTQHDDPSYVAQFRKGCELAGIPIEDVPIRQMLREEPILDPSIQQCFHVPDASADSFLAAKLNAESASQYGAKVLTYHEVVNLQLVRPTSGRTSVAGAVCRDLVKDETVQIDADMVVNASGAWAGVIAEMAGIKITMLPGKGTMLALNHRIVNTIISRCKMPSDGDILVPAHTVAVMGTTDIRVGDPDHYAIEPWEIRLLLDEGEKLVPSFKQFRILRAWAGVRPLIQDSTFTTDRDISRAFVLLDHAGRDGVSGLITISSGKWTTYRKMAEVTIDKVCEILDVDRACRTHLEELQSPGRKKPAYHILGARLEQFEQHKSYGQLICECELVHEQDVEQAIVQAKSGSLDDVRRSTRLGMGPCQGAFCTLRAAGMLQAIKHPPVEETNTALLNFIQGRWKGNHPILGGQQVRQARLNELIYINLLNTDHAPTNGKLKLEVANYMPSSEKESFSPDPVFSPASRASPVNSTHTQDVIVIGAGLSGLVAAWRTSEAGLKTSLLTRGWGATYWSSGCIDIFGYQPPDYLSWIESPNEFAEGLVKEHPEHPYAMAGVHTLESACQAFLQLCEDNSYPYFGSLEKNILLPTALGTLRTSCLIPMTMVTGNASDRSPMLIVGFSSFPDFYPALIEANLNHRGVLASSIVLELPTLSKRKFVNGLILARLFDNPDFCQELIDILKPKLGNAGRIGFPAVLGLKNTPEVLSQLQSSLGVGVFEISGLPPSIPGIRLHNLLISAIERNHGMVMNGMTVRGADIDGQTVQSIWTEAASRQVSHQANNFVLATGGILGGGISVSYNGYAQESILNLLLNMPHHRSHWFQPEFLAPGGHPIFQSGVSIDTSFHPANQSSLAVYQNLYAIGSALGHCDPVRERSLEGIALASGFRVGEIIARSKPA